MSDENGGWPPLSPTELQIALAATLTSLSATQGVLLRVLSNIQDVELGDAPGIRFDEMLDQWENANRTLKEAQTIIFGQGWADRAEEAIDTDA